MSYRDREDFAKELSEWYRLLRGMVRRVAVTLTSGVKWQVLGQRAGQGGDETWDVEPFTGIGFYARPPSSGNPEAIAVALGGAKSTAIVATRDEATRKTGAGDLVEDETCAFNSQVRVQCKQDGTIEARTHGGTASELAKNSEHADTRTKLNELITAFNAATGATIATLGAPGGTSVLKGE